MFQYLRVKNIKNNILIMSGRAKSIMNLLKKQIAENQMQDNEISTQINSNRRFLLGFK